MSSRIDGFEPRIGTPASDNYAVKPFGSDDDFRKKLEKEQMNSIHTASYSNNVAFNLNVNNIWQGYGSAGQQNSTGGVQA